MHRISLKFAAFAFAAALLGSSAAAWAHHSYSMFDRTTTVTVKGTIKAFQWTNPHVYIWLYVPNAKGGEDLWAVEGGSTSTLARRGWDRRVMLPGDKVILEINPLKDGRTGGYFSKLTRADGKIFTERDGA